MLIVMATKYHKMAELLAHRVLDWRGGQTQELRGVACSLLKCSTSHREWFTWRRQAKQEQLALLNAAAEAEAGRAPESQTSREARLQSQLLDKLWETRILPAMLWACAMADDLMEGGTNDN